MSQDFPQIIEHCETALRTGQGQLITHYFADLQTKDVPRRWRLPIANICRRAGLISLGLKILTPIVHPQKEILESAASAQELVEYAGLLERCGAAKEALKILKKI